MKLDALNFGYLTTGLIDLCPNLQNKSLVLVTLVDINMKYHRKHNCSVI